MAVSDDQDEADQRQPVLDQSRRTRRLSDAARLGGKAGSSSVTLSSGGVAHAVTSFRLMRGSSTA